MKFFSIRLVICYFSWLSGMTAIDRVILHAAAAAAIDGEFSEERLGTTRCAFFTSGVMVDIGLQ
jgi:hypothetical protein